MLSRETAWRAVLARGDSAAASRPALRNLVGHVSISFAARVASRSRSSRRPSRAARACASRPVALRELALQQDDLALQVAFQRALGVEDGGLFLVPTPDSLGLRQTRRGSSRPRTSPDNARFQARRRLREPLKWIRALYINRYRLRRSPPLRRLGHDPRPATSPVMSFESDFKSSGLCRTRDLETPSFRQIRRYPGFALTPSQVVKALPANDLNPLSIRIENVLANPFGRPLPSGFRRPLRRVGSVERPRCRGDSSWLRLGLF